MLVFCYIYCVCGSFGVNYFLSSKSRKGAYGMAIRELDKIPTKALMARITAELEGLIVTDADGRYI